MRNRRYDFGHMMYRLYIMNGWCVINGCNHFGNSVWYFYASWFTVYDSIETIVSVGCVIDNALMTI